MLTVLSQGLPAAFFKDTPHASSAGLVSLSATCWSIAMHATKMQAHASRGASYMACGQKCCTPEPHQPATRSRRRQLDVRASMQHPPHVMAASVAAAPAVVQKQPQLPSKLHHQVDFAYPTQLHGEVHKTIDVLGLAQAMVDYTAELPNEQLLQEPPFLVGKGARRVISLQERHDIIDALESHGCQSQVSAGGSLANSLVGIARLAQAQGSPLRVSMAGSVGGPTDGFLGAYFNSQLQAAGVNVLVDEDNMAHTGTVMVLTTPDAQRSFLSFFDSSALWLTPRMRQAICSARVVVVEGYMLELPGAGTWLQEVLTLAKSAGAQIVLTAGDPSVVMRHRSVLESILQQGLVDVMFCNREEAAALVNCCTDKQERRCSARALAGLLATYTAGVAVVTDGSKGSYLGVRGLDKVCHMPASTLAEGHSPVDVCGAGDAFAAGLLYCLLSGYDIQTAGSFASQVAAAVICKHGASLEEEDARKLVHALPDYVPLATGWPGSSTANVWQ